MFKIIEPLVEADLFEFLSLFPESSYECISIELYNGTGTGYTELPNGGHLTQRKYSMAVTTLDSLKAGLDYVDHNQVQKCGLFLKGSISSATLEFLTKELSINGTCTTKELDPILAFCRAKGIRSIKLHLSEE